STVGVEDFENDFLTDDTSSELNADTSSEQSGQESEQETDAADSDDEPETLDFDEFENFEGEQENKLDADFVNDLTQAVEETKEESVEVEKAENDIDTFDITDTQELTLSDDTGDFDIFENFEIENTTDENSDINTEAKDSKASPLADTAKTIGEAVLGAGAAAAGAAAIAGAAEIAASAGATSEAIKLAGVSGDILENLIEQNAANQQTQLNKIDYTNIDVNAEEIPEEIASIISTPAKTDDNEEYVTPTDLSDLQTVENTSNNEEFFEHETVDMNNMETVQTDDLEHITELNTGIGEEGFDLPDLSSPEMLNEVEDFALDTLTENEEHLADFPSNLEETEILTEDENTLSLDSDNLETLALEETPTEDLTEDFSSLAEEFPEENISLEINDLELQEDNAETTEPEFNIDSDKEDKQENEPAFEDLTENTDEEIDFGVIEDFDNLEDIGILEDFETEEPAKDEIPTTEDFTMEEEEKTLAQIEETVETDIADISEFDNIETFDEIELDDIPEPNIEQNDEITDINEELEIETSEEITDFENVTESEQTTEEEKITEPELDEEFSTDLNTEFNADETLHDAEPIKDLETDAIIENPDEEIPSVFENSIVISDKTFTVGEIPIDINVVNKPHIETDELSDLYNQNDTTPSMLNTPGRTGKNTAHSQKAGLGIIGGLLTLVIVCVIGFGVAKMFKSPTEETPQPTTDDALPTDTIDTQVPAPEALEVDQNNVVNMDKNTDAIATQTPSPGVQNNTPANVQPATPATAPAAKKPIPATSFIEVKKLSWEVPDYIAYNPQFKQYFQATGRSLKLSLTTDLLLAKEFAYTNEIKVTITYNQDGSFKEARIVKSSGSTQIDKIVLQTVNQTLNVLKAPHSVGNDENTVAILKIYL
ncbi:MAG: TonB C-terminal domain-containing protein, partial [Muribaculaceae bacterium]|nr:TonB C-terminal domain-containing protein [Muribaculaceae bacterium]